MKSQGVYFIHEKNTLVYVGKTTNLHARFKNHKSITSGRYYKFLPVENLSNMALLELAYIDLYKPVENKQDKFASENSLTINLPTIDHLPLIPVPGTNIQGTKLMKIKAISEAVRATVSSKTDAALFAHFIDNCKRHNVVTKEGSTEPANTDYLAKRYGVTVQKVRSYIRKAIEHNFIRKAGTKFFINPYTVVPFTIGTSAIENDQIANQLQLWWESGNTDDPIKSLELLSEEDLLKHATRQFMEEM